MQPSSFLHPSDKIHPDDSHMVIGAEIPDKEADSDLHYTVKPLMIHGLCGAYNKNSTCVKD